MKMMVLYAQAGGGHRKAAEAIAEQGTSQGHLMQLVDALKEVGPLEDQAICGSYRLMARYIPQAFGLLYRQANKETGLSQLTVRLNEFYAHRLLSVIEDCQPDVIISTYHFASEMVSHLKTQGKVQAPLVCVITDYGLHRAWLAPQIDAYAVACEEMVAQLSNAGVSRKKIHVSGMPVGANFAHPKDPAACKAQLNLLPDLPLVLMMAGSFGVDKVIQMYQAAAALEENFQLAVITGRNPHLYESLRQLLPHSPKPTKLVSFTHKVADYMAAADLLVTKPGGMTVSEALAMELPMVVFDAIPGQEEDNAHFLTARGLAEEVQNSAEAAEAIARLMRCPGRLEAMRQSCRRFGHKQAAAEIIDLAQTLSQEQPLWLK